MLDIKLIREQTERVKQGLSRKGYSPASVDQLVVIDEQRRELMSQIESKRAEQKKLDFQNPEQLAKAKELKDLIDSLGHNLTKIDEGYKKLMLDLPNLPEANVPVGEGETANRVIKTVGDKPALTNPLDQTVLAEKHDLFDTERAGKVAGARFYYLKNQSVLLEFGLVRMAFDLAIKHGYTPMITPQLVNEKTVLGTGYLPHGADEVYKTQDDLYLIGTSELALVAYRQDEIISEKELPIRYVGFSSCFRREAGSYGKDTQGIIRQHQFDKVEMVSFVKPEEAEAELQRILAIEEELMALLGLPYQVVEIGTGDLGIQASRKYDIETWMPGQDKYRETHSCSNTTDFQARRLNIRYKTEAGENRFVATLNGTAVAISRMLVALFENGQQPDGTIIIPDALAKYVGFNIIS